MNDSNSEKSKLISNRYRIIKKIASGGMADVFLGDDLKSGRKVALKILSSSYASDKNFVARFKSEAQILARLNHPNIVKVYDWGKFNGFYFICIEYVRGESLKEIIERKGPLPPETSTSYAIQISSALLMAHKNNLIHRDIKPENILITPEGKVKVTDFGIAKSLITDVTKTLNILGTAQYISPEQAKGEVLDHRTDIYSLGIVMYEMLTADVPFRGGSSIDISLKHINEKPLKPSELIENIPEKLEKIVMHCLEKDPEARYASLSELISDLKTYKTVRPLSFGIKAKSPARTGGFKIKMKSPFPVIFIGAFMLIFLASSITYTYKYYSLLNSPISLITIPPIENISADKADEIVSVYGLNLKIGNEVFNSEIPEGYIIEQNPSPGEKTAPGSDIEIVLSRGPEETSFNVPNLIGLTLEEAQDLLASCGLETGNLTRQYSETFKEDLIIRQDPASGENAGEIESVNFTLSRGEEFILIPNIIGENYIEASNYLISLGLNIQSSKYPINEGDNIKEPGKIVKVVPSPGTEVEANSIVKLLISTNESLIEVPDLGQLGMEQATDLLKSINMNYVISYVQTDYSVKLNTVLEQIPESGTYISPDSSIILFIGS
ncbi:MAG: protein kinase [Actinomycetota bacterium]|nr:protein kinase [Actinomycetota bacterium]